MVKGCGVVVCRMWDVGFRIPINRDFGAFNVGCRVLNGISVGSMSFWRRESCCKVAYCDNNGDARIGLLCRWVFLGITAVSPIRDVYL